MTELTNKTKHNKQNLCEVTAFEIFFSSKSQILTSPIFFSKYRINLYFNFEPCYFKKFTILIFLLLSEC